MREKVHMCMCLCVCACVYVLGAGEKVGGGGVKDRKPDMRYRNHNRKPTATCAEAAPLLSNMNV